MARANETYTITHFDGSKDIISVLKVTANGRLVIRDDSGRKTTVTKETFEQLNPQKIPILSSGG